MKSCDDCYYSKYVGYSYLVGDVEKCGQFNVILTEVSEDGLTKPCKQCGGNSWRDDDDHFKEGAMKC